ncbi:MAG: prephenate dehydratase [Gammaproteobacteria bacterium WSBS_2016_MAG_OTU1]
MKEDLLKIREQIDSVDDKLMALLRERATLAKKVGDIKQQAGEQGFARLDRQADILRRLAPKGELLKKESVRAIYNEIMSACLAVEKPPTVAYLGPANTFTHDAARKFFGDGAEYTPATSIRGAISRAEESDCDFAVLPFENSNQGTVGETFDALLSKHSLTINGEIMLRVRHNILANSKLAFSQIEMVYAHPQALAQCRLWLEQNMPQAKTEPTISNAAAAKIVAERAYNYAAIASESAGKHYRLETLAAGIEDNASNTTRFFILGKSSPAPSESDKTSFVMTTPSKAGALHHLLEPLTRLDINMTKFESRPSNVGIWEYVFFVDIDGHQQTENVAQALKEMGERTEYLKVLGSYPKAVE